MTVRVARVAAACIATLAAAGLSFDASRFAMADTIVDEANAVLATPAWRQAAPALAPWLKLRESLQEARRIEPGDPAVHEALGVLHGRRVSSPDLLAYAQEDFTRALERRPTSPYAWANLALARFLLGDKGPRLEEALVNAARLGPWEPEVQLIVSDVGLAVHDDVRPATRAAIDAMLDAGMNRIPLQILDAAERRGRLDIACRHLAASRGLAPEQREKYCGD